MPFRDGAGALRLILLRSVVGSVPVEDGSKS